MSLIPDFAQVDGSRFFEGSPLVNDFDLSGTLPDSAALRCEMLCEKKAPKQASKVNVRIAIADLLDGDLPSIVIDQIETIFDKRPKQFSRFLQAQIKQPTETLRGSPLIFGTYAPWNLSSNILSCAFRFDRSVNVSDPNTSSYIAGALAEALHAAGDYATALSLSHFAHAHYEDYALEKDQESLTSLMNKRIFSTSALADNDHWGHLLPPEFHDEIYFHGGASPAFEIFENRSIVRLPVADLTVFDKDWRIEEELEMVSPDFLAADFYGVVGISGNHPINPYIPEPFKMRVDKSIYHGPYVEIGVYHHPARIIDSRDYLVKAIYALRGILPISY